MCVLSSFNLPKMIAVRRWIVLFFVFATCSETVIPNTSLEDAFRYCLISQSQSTLGQCFGVGVINKLQSFENSPEFDLVDGVTLTRDAREFREEYRFDDGDPTSLRSLLDTMGGVFSRRNLQWNMDMLYPGLMLRVAPSVSAGGQLEFVLDAHREALNVQSLKEASTGRLLARQFILPILLGFKFKVASLVPILFGVLALLAKKALIISKLALVLVSAFGLGSLVFGYGNGHGQSNYGYQTYHPGFSPGHHGGYKYVQEEYDPYYRTSEEKPQDQIRLYDNIEKSFSNKEHTQGRNFAWEDKQKNNPNPT